MDCSVKEKGDYVQIDVDAKVYSLELIFAAGYVFLDRAYIILDRKKDKILVYLYPQKKKKNLKKLGLEFFNELLNYAHYFSSLKRNSEAIKLIMQRAFFSANPTLAKKAEDQYIKRQIKKELDG